MIRMTLGLLVVISSFLAQPGVVQDPGIAFLIGVALFVWGYLNRKHG